LLDIVRPLLHRRDQANLVLVREVIRADQRVVVGFALVAVPLAVLLAPAVRRRRWRVVFAIVVGLVVSVSVVASHAIQPRLARPRSFEAFMTAVRRVVPVDEAIVFHRRFDYGAVFYWGDRIPVLEDALTVSAGERPRFALVWQRDWELLAVDAKAPVEVLLSSAPARDDLRGHLLLVRVPGGRGS
jgi:hypothetical protein